MVMGWESARTTAPYQMEDSSQLVTFPITDAEGAMNVSLVVKGLFPMNVTIGLCLVKICVEHHSGGSQRLSYIHQIYCTSLIGNWMKKKGELRFLVLTSAPPASLRAAPVSRSALPTTAFTAVLLMMDLIG